MGYIANGQVNRLLRRLQASAKTYPERLAPPTGVVGLGTREHQFSTHFLYFTISYIGLEEGWSRDMAVVMKFEFVKK